MTGYFDAVDASKKSLGMGNRGRIIDGVKRFVEEEFGAETSQLNLNSWRLRFDLDVKNQEELEEVVSRVNKLIEDECPFDVELEWEYIPTDGNGQKNGYFTAGSGDFDTSVVRGGSYPIEAFKVTVPSQFGE